MTPVELKVFLLIGTLCGTIQDTSPISISVYSEHDDIALALEISCIRSKIRDEYITPKPIPNDRYKDYIYEY